MVLAHAVDRHAAVVQVVAVAFPFGLAHAENRFLPVADFSVFGNGRPQREQRGVFDVPKLDAAQRDFDGNAGLARGARERVSVFQNFMGDGNRRGIGVLRRVDRGFDGNFRRFREAFSAVGANAGNLRRPHPNAVVGDGDGVFLDEPDVAVNARARIPARRVRQIFRAHGDDVVPAEIQERRDVDAERGIAVFPFAGELSVHVDLRHHHHAVEVEKEFLARLVRGN